MNEFLNALADHPVISSFLFVLACYLIYQIGNVAKHSYNKQVLKHNTRLLELQAEEKGS